ncbi:S-layer homology domain-containing protein [Phormidesmis priestleyi]
MTRIEKVVCYPIVLSSKRLTALSVAAFLLLPLASCTSPVSKSLQDALAADPQLRDNPSVFGSPQATPSPIVQTNQAQLPADFPAEIPLYPNRALLEVSQPDQEFLTRWSSPDGSDRVVDFYRQELQKNGWKLDGQPIDKTQGTFEASRDGLQVTVNVRSGTEFEIRVDRPSTTASVPQTGSSQAGVPKPGSPDFVGPIPSAMPNNSSISSSDPQGVAATPGSFTDLNKVPKELQKYTQDLIQLGVLDLSANKSTSKNQNLFEPNKVITRREYARWLVTANNRIYASRPARQIRLAVETSQPAFQDVARTDADFATIQGLAEAGLIPSSLSGNSTAVLFRPDAPLTREEMILWKMPVDMRQALPTATIESVRQTWGFQDAARIDSKALRAVLADFQNGDQSNLRRAFGYTTLFQPKRSVTRAEAAAVLWYFGFQGDGISAQEALKGVPESTNPKP